MLVVDGKLIAVAKRVPGHVKGDGKQTIQALVDIVNEDPLRGIGHEKVLTQIQIDQQAERLMTAKDTMSIQSLKEMKYYIYVLQLICQRVERPLI